MYSTYSYLLSFLVNGEDEYIGVSKMPRDEIVKWLDYLRKRPGIPEMKYLKMWHTDTPSIQGVWSPFTHRNPALNLVEFPQVSIVSYMWVGASVFN